MRVCVVSSYHLEVTAPYIKRLQDIHEVDFYVPVNNGDKNVFLFNFDATAIKKNGVFKRRGNQESRWQKCSLFQQPEEVVFFSLS